ncbi:hypothetical protein NA56DRAFT_712259 [Hyaloscypha hepaticicola]|uniref:Uncharacterized protein n=1 Tax=Hyaloscypha hepaticicola TaxID=2082293 RepID=A0A2J6PGS5_9HELO|nr:hypothetical protein NA56DRAFT_712259 [Hyaloscypha hepaticicola]
MSFGYSVSDFLLICEKAKAIVDACRQGPAELQELSNEVWTLQKTVDQLSSDAQDPNSILNRRGSARRGDLEQIIDNCKTALAEIESFISKHTVVESASSSLRTNARRVWHDYQVGMANLDNSRNKLTFYTSTINVFLGSLNAAAMGRVMHRLDEIYSRIMDVDRRSSAASTNSFNSIISFATGEPDLSGWSFIQNELSGFGVSREDIEDNQGKIIEYVKKLVNQSISDHGGDNPQLGPLIRIHVSITTT